MCRGSHRWELLTPDSSSRATINSPFKGLLNSIQAPVQPLYIANTCVQNLCSLSQDLICMNPPSILLDPCSKYMCFASSSFICTWSLVGLTAMLCCTESACLLQANNALYETHRAVPSSRPPPACSKYSRRLSLYSDDCFPALAASSANGTSGLVL